jgi:2-polyprenyl-3-methyl-5-hydroxy-6-metoxy-1,4-benzoquinol methylase
MKKWEFNKELAPNFVDHAKKHIPDYDKVIDISIDLCKDMYHKHSTIIDVGCASGETLKRLHNQGFSNIYGVDNSQAMLDVCPKDIAKYKLSDTYPTNFPPMDVIICNWTLHFIKDKISYLKSIKENLKVDGTFILSEKTTLDPFMISKYHEFKIQNGVTEEEIKIKEKQLLDVMFINDTEWYINTLKDLGFNKVNVINAHYCFNTFICRF